MDWLSSNWIWVAFIVGMVAMHLFGHGGHGGHGGCGGNRAPDAGQDGHPQAANPKEGR